MAGCGRSNCPSRKRERTGCWSTSRPPASRRSITRSWRQRRDRSALRMSRPFGLRPRHATGALCGNDRLLEIGGVPGGHCARHGVAILRYAEHAERTRRYDDQSKDVGLSLPRQFCRDCIIATRGYDFREGQPLSPSQSCPGCTTTTSGHNFRKGQVALESNDGK
jgi:hypothetical protein